MIHVIVLGLLLGFGIGLLAEVVPVVRLAGVAQAALTPFQHRNSSLGWWCLSLAVDSL